MGRLEDDDLRRSLVVAPVTVADVRIEGSKQRGFAKEAQKRDMRRRQERRIGRGYFRMTAVDAFSDLVPKNICPKLLEALECHLFFLHR